jgi:hypothetical protein
MADLSAYNARWIAAFPYLGAVSQQQQMPSGLKHIPCDDTTAEAPGTEFAGVGIAPLGSDNAGSGVQPNGILATPAQNITNKVAALDGVNPGSGIFPVQGTSTAVV